MSCFLQQLATEYPHDDILMILDGAGWHRAKGLVVPPSITLLVLPPYAPELNPAEHLWDEIREKAFANRTFDDLDAVVAHLATTVHQLHREPSRVQRLCGFHWIVNIR
jgi:transposase